MELTLTDKKTSVVTDRLVTVIVPSYNSVSTTGEALVSLQKQTYRNWVAIVVDDGSSESNRVELAFEIAKLGDKRIQFVSCRDNEGVASARNTGLDYATTDLVAFLDSDDLWLPEKLERQIAFMNEKKAAISFTTYKNVDAKTGYWSNRVPDPKVKYDELLAFNSIGNSTVILDRSLLKLPRIPDLRRRQDFAFWLAILKDGHIGYGLQEPLTIRRISRRSLSGNKFAAARDTWTMYREVFGLGAIKSSCLVGLYGLHLLKLRCIRFARKL